MSSSSDVMFHVMKHGERLVIFRMGPDGSRSIFLPGRKTVEQAWPGYETRLAASLDLWFDDQGNRDKVRGVLPGEAAYPEALARELTQDWLLGVWAYVTPPAIFVSFNQIAYAVGHAPTAKFRDELQAKMRFKDGRTLLPTVTRILGSEVANNLLLYPNQVANHLGVRPQSATRIIKRLGVAITRDDDSTLISWGNLQRIKRIGPHKFELSE